MKALTPLALSLVVVARASTAFACAGNEYWQDDPKGTPVWTVRKVVEVEKDAEARVDDNLLRVALAKSGLKSCSGVEKNLIDADVKRAIRTEARPIAKEKFWANYDEVTQLMIRYRRDLHAGAVLEVMTRTKICWDGGGRFVPALAKYQQDAVAQADKVARNLDALLSK
jgi:hypothetical protein